MTNRIKPIVSSHSNQKINTNDHDSYAYNQTAYQKDFHILYYIYIQHVAKLAIDVPRQSSNIKDYCFLSLLTASIPKETPHSRDNSSHT